MPFPVIKKIADIPQFALYGEQTRAENAEFVHIELIETRSRMYDWHIDNHTHPGLFQVLFLFAGAVRATVGDALWERQGPAVITIHPSVVHGFDFSPQAQGYVLTVDQNVIFSTADNQGDLYSTLFVEPLAIDLAGLPEVGARLEALLQHLLAEAAWPQFGHTLMLEWLARAALLYAERHAEADGRIPATFEMVHLAGWAPHESQQKPARRGSAKSRLADALGVREQTGET